MPDAPYAQLVGAIGRVKQVDPFAAVTVVVPHRAVGHDVMRHLAEHLRGAVGVRVHTVLDLAQEVAGRTAELQGRTPLSTTSLRHALATELETDPLCFAEVADQAATLDALTAASTRLLRAEHLDAPDLPPITRDVITLHRRALASLDSVLTAQDVFRAATRILDEQPAARADLGHTLLFQVPTQHDPAASDFVTALVPVLVVDTVRHDPATVRRSIDALLSVTDPVQEVAAAVESIATALADGSIIAGQRIGVFFPVRDPYLDLVCTGLEDAGIVFTARSARPASASPAARAVLRILELDADSPDLRIVLDAAWEGALQRTGVADGQDLPSSRSLERAFVVGTDPDACVRDHEEADFALLTAYASDLCTRLRAIDDAPTWATATAQLAELVAHVLRDGVLPEERRAAGRIRTAITAIAPQDPDAPNPGRTVLAEHLASELAQGTARIGSLSTGVTVGTLPSAVGRDLDLVIVLGMADGLAPAPSVIDPLFPEGAVEKLGGAMQSERQVRAEARDQFAAALSAGTRTLVTTPRGNLRESGPRFLSPWIAPHRAVTVADPAELPGEDQLPGITHLRHVFGQIASPLAGTRDGFGATAGPTTLPATIGRAWHRAQLTGTQLTDQAVGGSALPDLPDRARLAREIRAERRAGDFGRFTGNVSVLTSAVPLTPDTPSPFAVTNPAATAPGPTPVDGVRISPTALEKWAKDPFEYFLERVLCVDLFAYPDEEESADPLMIGNIVHETLELVVDEQLSTGAVPEDARIEEILASVFARHERASWSAVLWRDQQRTARTMVLREVAELRTGAFLPLGAESSFGMEEDGVPHLEVDLGNGKVVLVRGSVDRIDRTSGGTLRVVDYKTGKSDSYASIVGEPEGVRRGRTDRPFDPTAGGTRLQLPLYALHALRDHTEEVEDTHDLHVEYHFLGSDLSATNAVIGFSWIPEVHEEFLHQLRRITDAIEDGFFPLHAGEPSTFGSTRVSWYSVMGQRDQWRLSEKLLQVPEVAAALEPTTLQAIRAGGSR